MGMGRTCSNNRPWKVIKSIREQPGGKRRRRRRRRKKKN
jgi:hypothetical protein